MKRNTLKDIIIIITIFLVAIIISYVVIISSQQSIPNIGDIEGVMVSGSIVKEQLEYNQVNVNTDRYFIEKAIAAHNETKQLEFKIRDLSLKSPYQYIRIEYKLKDGTIKIYTYKERQCRVYDIWSDIIIDGWL